MDPGNHIKVLRAFRLILEEHLTAQVVVPASLYVALPDAGDVRLLDRLQHLLIAVTLKTALALEHLVEEREGFLLLALGEERV